jgi:hypothetical protein
LNFYPSFWAIKNGWSGNWIKWTFWLMKYWMRQYNPQNVQMFDNLMLYLKRFECIQEVSTYINSDEYKSWPIFLKVLSLRYSKWFDFNACYYMLALASQILIQVYELIVSRWKSKFDFLSKIYFT